MMMLTVRPWPAVSPSPLVVVVRPPASVVPALAVVRAPASPDVPPRHVAAPLFSVFSPPPRVHAAAVPAPPQPASLSPDSRHF